MPSELQDQVRFVQQYHQRQPDAHTPTQEVQSHPTSGPMPPLPPEDGEHGQRRKGGGYPVGLNPGSKRVGQVEEKYRQAKAQHIPQGHRTGFIPRSNRCRRTASQSPETHERQNHPH